MDTATDTVVCILYTCSMSGGSKASPCSMVMGQGDNYMYMFLVITIQYKSDMTHNVTCTVGGLCYIYI